MMQIAESTSFPASSLGWLSWCWSRVLFPGPQPSVEPVHWRSLLLVVFVPMVFLYPCMSFYLFEPDEGRYAQIPREMLESGEWIVPTLQGEPYLDKPPLFYWLVMCSYAVFGYHDWAARLIPALAVHGTLLAAFFFGRRTLGDRAGLWGTMVLLAAPLFAGMGRLLVLDGLLTLWVTIGLGAGFLALQGNRPRRGWWLLAAAACGLGILTKGPVAVVLVLPPLWLHRRLSGQGTWSGWREWLMFVAVILALNLPWYGALCWRLPNFAKYFFWEHNVVRFLQPFDHERPVWFYIPIVGVGWLSGTLLGVPFFRFLNSEQEGEHRPASLGFWLLAGGWCLLFFSLAGCKLPTYILPAFPPLSLAVGGCLAHGRARSLRWAQGVIGSCLAVTLLCHYVIVPHVARVRTPMNEQVAELCADRATPVYCFPRHIDSVAFYVGRADFKNYRSKDVAALMAKLPQSQRAILLLGHRSSLDLVKHHLPARLRLVDAPMGLCDLAVVERVDW